MPTREKLIEVIGIQKSFKNSQDDPGLLVIDDVNFTLYEGEIVALVGQSGSGKSTLLRIIAGLTAPSQGEVIYRGKPVRSPVPGITMVFQSFALMPWLTVLQNVELGLEALGITGKDCRDRALHAIDIIGMDGFENAYPKELSGGMRQRVGVARALVVKPDLLLMDEPFSALDVLTAESLRGDVIELWQKEEHMKGILFVTHNIEEAVLTADRILIFGSNPGNLKHELAVGLAHPRNSQDPQVLALIDEVYRLMTSSRASAYRKTKPLKTVDISYRLPETSVAELIGLLEEVAEIQEKKGVVDLPELADVVRLDIDDLFPVLETLSILNLARVSEGDIIMTTEGENFLSDDITDKKVRFARLLREHIPLAKFIEDTLQTQTQQKLHKTYFLDKLEPYFTTSEADRVLHTLIDWARYAELFSYDYNTGNLSLEDVE